MRVFAIAVFSFALGALSALIGSQAAMFAQESTKPTWQVNDAVPVVPPFRSHILSHSSFVNSAFPVDGNLCKNCLFEGTTFQYGGGEYAIVESQVAQPVYIQLTGAALNTAKFLNTFGLIGCPANEKPRTVSPIPPVLKARFTAGGSFKSDHSN